MKSSVSASSGRPRQSPSCLIRTCALYDAGHQDGTEYLVMELLEGEALAERLVRGPLPLDRTLWFGAQIASALDAVHRKAVIHRDLKPSNVMLTKSGVKLLDFGLARTLAPAWSSFDVSPDGKRLLAVVPEVVADELPLSVVVNWPATLKGER